MQMEVDKIMTLIDTHCHLNMMVKKEFDVPLTQSSFTDIPVILAAAEENSVRTIINVGTSLPESLNCIELAKRFPQAIYAAIGIHPNDLNENWRQEIAILDTLLQQTKPGIIVAIGECGLDKHYPDYNITRQQEAFKLQIELALKHELPLLVHTRDAASETLEVLAEFKHTPLRGIIHCFSEDLNFAQTAISQNFVLGLGGTITYPKNEILRQVTRTVPLEKIVLETDAPFLPIQKMRGQQNHPQYIQAIAQYIAELRGISLAAVAEQTTRTARELFRIK
jgi:TatD DNase family protein